MRSLQVCCLRVGSGDASLCSEGSQEGPVMSRADVHGQGGAVLSAPWQKTGHQWSAFCARGRNGSCELDLWGGKGRGFISLK